MVDFFIILVVIVFVFFGIRHTKRHFKGGGGCCGSGSVPVKKQNKKLKHVIAQKTVKIEGMTCEHCKNRVEKSINDLDGAAAKVNLSKKEAVVSLEREISDEEIIAVIEKAGYQVTGIK